MVARELHHGIRCPRCKDEIYSDHRHDFKYCSCKYVFVDGGRDYLRFGWGVPYSHEHSTKEEKELAISETARIGMPEQISKEVRRV